MVENVSSGCKFNNLDRVLVYMRFGAKDSMLDVVVGNTSGVKLGLQKLRYKHRIISFPRYLFNMTVHFTVKVLMPNSVRGWVFQKLLRE